MSEGKPTAVAVADIELRVKSVLATVFNIAASSIDSATSMDTVENWDSLQQLSVILALEEEFQIFFDDEETVSLVSFPLIVAIVAERLSAL